MALSERQLLDALSRTPFVDSTELALILGEPHATVHRTLGNLLAEGIVGRVSHGTAHLPSSQRYHLTANGIGEAAWVLGFATPSDFVRAYPASQGTAHAAHPQDGRGGTTLEMAGIVWNQHSQNRKDGHMANKERDVTDGFSPLMFMVHALEMIAVVLFLVMALGMSGQSSEDRLAVLEVVGTLVLFDSLVKSRG